MVWTRSALAVKLDFGEPRGQAARRGLRLASVAGEMRGAEKYRLLDLQRRRAQIRARRLLGLSD
jgi:hypothetical protein